MVNNLFRVFSGDGVMRNSLLVLVCLCCFVSTKAFAQEERLVVRKGSKDPSLFVCETKHATFNVPKDWQPNQSGGATYAILTKSNETYPKVSQMISIDIGKPSEPTAKKLAEAFAKKFNGSVGEVAIEIDGEKGWRVTIPTDKKSIRPVDCIVAFKDGRSFLLIGAAKEAGDLPKALDELVAGWKWKK